MVLPILATASLALLLNAASVSAQAPSTVPLMPPQGQVYLGAWYQRVEGDTPRAVNDRIKGIPNSQGLSFFQTDIDISLGKDPRTTLDITDGYLAQLEDTGTDAMAYLTIYPFKGFDGVTDDQLNELGDRIKRILDKGRKLFLRLYPEMNGSWFNFGQDPTGFITAWRRAYDTITARIGASNRDKVAFVWAPNSGNGYPYPGGIASPTPTDPRFQLLDTNKDGVFNTEDNAYSPYYPGDAYVDWVGLSIYHYGSQWPWLQNVVPESNKFEGLMQGSFNPAWGNFPFYDEFSGTLNRTGVTAGNKPFILAEGGATFHVSLNDIGRGKNFAEPDVTTTSRSSIKKAFWSSFLNTDFLAKYPNFKAACTFEFIKSEEDTVRDFSNFGPPPTNRTGNEDGDAVAAAFVEDAKGMTFVKWAGSASTLIPTTGAPPAVRTGATTTNAPVKTGVPVVVTTTTTRTGGAEKGGVVGVASAVMVLASFFAFM